MKYGELETKINNNQLPRKKARRLDFEKFTYSFMTDNEIRSLEERNAERSFPNFEF